MTFSPNFKLSGGRGRDILREISSKEMTSEADGKLGSWKEKVDGEQRSPKRTLGTSFRLQTLPICVTNNFPTASQNHGLFIGESLEKKSF